MSLYWRIFLLNAGVLAVATALLLGPVTVSTPVRFGEAVIVLGGLAAMLVINAVLLKVGLAPLARLNRAMDAADLLKPGARPAADGNGEIAALTRTFNAMLDRLEAERATSSGRVLTALEAERKRIAQELHDEIGQTLTAVLLQLKHVADHAPEPVRTDLHQVQETTRASLDEIRRIARRLRPGVLEELGLHSALRSLATEFTTRRLGVTAHLTSGLPQLDPATELVLYRVAQEGLTNAARHSGATRVEVHLRPRPGHGVVLLVTDNGRGPGDAPEGAGIRGMRERALLIGAELVVGAGRHGGTQVRLTVTDTAGTAAANITDTMGTSLTEAKGSVNAEVRADTGSGTDTKTEPDTDPPGPPR
ncbi:sensor histidine kinase [Streptomyces bambusae]|uniref:HAMP domain-containing sensor histidine kinase n=1 Tax=Streptomyces bambusae TaxID=1550616 RepID=UPI001CFE7852|nr:sensor histidine kinase [Streptomyces bambusae]MCB5163913.1 sensor histidine kinase [Streptomyces bambusae]